jgi:hypothetical protein
LKRKNNKPNIENIFKEDDFMNITENGVYPHYSLTEYEKIVIKNLDDSDNIKTRIIFKYGNAIEYHFKKIQNRIYSNQNDENRAINLFGYIYDQTRTKLNDTGVDFEIRTVEEAVKCCYSITLGAFINPSLQNCFRVGRNHMHTISTINPLVMYRNYYSREHINYYISFRTVELNQNITILPILKKYNTDIRYFEGSKNKIFISLPNLLFWKN